MLKNDFLIDSEAKGTNEEMCVPICRVSILIANESRIHHVIGLGHDLGY